MMFSFCVQIHPHAVGTAAGSITLRGRTWPTLVVQPGPQPHLHVTFDRAVEILATLPRMFIEPDGSFVFTGEAAGERWQVDGVLYDAGPRLSYVAAAGRCPVNAFEQLLAPLGWPALPLMFHLVPEGVNLAEVEFRRWAAGTD